MRFGGWAIPLSFCVFGVANAQAQDWHYSGFINQTAINTSDNYMFGDTDDQVSFDYRELALIIFGPIYKSLDFSSQLLSRTAGNSEDGSPRVDYAFASWRLYESLSITHGLRLGRLKAPIGFYNDVRDSPFTRFGVFLPQPLYFDRTRNFTMQLDGLMYFGEWRNDQWSLSWKTDVGRNNPDKKEMRDVFHLPDDLNTNFKSSRTWHFQLMADYDAGRIRFGYTEYQSPIRYSIAVTPLIDPINSEAISHWRALSFEYNDPDWSFTTEVNRGVVTYNGITPDASNPDYKDYPAGAFAQFRWNLNAKNSVFVRKEFNYLDSHDKEGTEYVEFPLSKAGHIVSADRFNEAVVVGWSYSPSSNWLVRADLSKNRGALTVAGRSAPEEYLAKTHWNMAALAVAWRF